MSGRKVIILGTRGSELARAQSGMIADMIRGLTDIPVEMKIIKTRGDRIQNIALSKVEGKGFFTKEIEDALLDGRIDVAVHSLKDLPTANPPGLTIAAMPKREDSHDILVIHPDAYDESEPLKFKKNAVVGTSSKRRAIQLLRCRPDIELKDLRGNVPTRIGKLVDGKYDAIVLAHAGYRRLGLSPEGYKLHVIDFVDMLPAPGQGALAIQTRESDDELRAILKPLHHQPTADAVAAERTMLELLGGGCGTPLGTHAEQSEEGIFLDVRVGPLAWEPGHAVTLERAFATGANAETVARTVFDMLSVRYNDNQRDRVKYRRLFMPVLKNGAAKVDDLFAGLPVEYIPVPVTEIRPVATAEQFNDIAKRLSDFDWIVFSSANGVELFFDGIGVEQMPRIACVGPDTAALLEERGHTVEFTPSAYTGADLAEEFSVKYIGSNFNILLPRPRKMGSAVDELLTAKGHSIESFVLYTTEPIAKPAPLESDPEADDIFAFRSPSGVRAFIDSYGLPENAWAVAIGPTTEAALRDAGHKRVVTANESSRVGLIAAVSDLLKQLDKEAEEQS